MTMTNRDDLPREPPVGFRYSDGYEGPYRRPRNKEEKRELSPPGPGMIATGVLGALLSVTFATMSWWGQRLATAFTIGFVILFVWGVAKWAGHNGKMGERYKRR